MAVRRVERYISSPPKEDVRPRTSPMGEPPGVGGTARSETSTPHPSRGLSLGLPVLSQQNVSTQHEV